MSLYHRSRLLVIIVLCALMLGVSGCSVKKYLGLSHANNLKHISVSCSQDCNSHSPVEYDLVFVFDAGAASSLSSLSGPQWFRDKQALQLSLGPKITTVSHDIVPLTSATELSLPKKSRDAVAVLLFANYLAAPGQVAAALQGYKSVAISFEASKYQIKAGDK